MTQELKPTECYFCDKCTSPREANPCWKCNSPARLVLREYVELKTPDFNDIKRLCFDMGYCAAKHGSGERDMDIMAMPWVKNAVVPRVLIQHLADNLTTDNGRARILAIEEMPMGRIAATIQMDGTFKPIDISIAPMLKDNTVPFSTLKTAMRTIAETNVTGLASNHKVGIEMDARDIFALQFFLGLHEEKEKSE